MFKILKKNRLVIFYLFLFAFISLSIVVINLGLTKNFIGEDSGVIFDFPNTLSKLIYFMWDSSAAPGKPNVTSTINFIWNNFVLLLSYLGLSGFFIKRVLYFSFFFFSGIGMFFLTRFLISPNSKQNQNSVCFASFIAGLLYMINHFSRAITSFPIISYHLSYILFPWITMLFIYNLKTKTNFFSIWIFSLMIIIFMGGNLSNLSLIHI